MSEEKKAPEKVKPLTPEEFNALLAEQVKLPEAERRPEGTEARLIATVLYLQGMVGQLGADGAKRDEELAGLRLAVMCMCKARGGRIFVPLKHMEGLGPRARLNLTVDPKTRECRIDLENGGVVLAGDFQAPKA